METVHAFFIVLDWFQWLSTQLALLFLNLFFPSLSSTRLHLLDLTLSLFFFFLLFSFLFAGYYSLLIGKYLEAGETIAWFTNPLSLSVIVFNTCLFQALKNVIYNVGEKKQYPWWSCIGWAVIFLISLPWTLKSLEYYPSDLTDNRWNTVEFWQR